ncbi:MAG: pitrilysin family protein, partial [Bacteroidota bacterium]
HHFTLPNGLRVLVHPVRGSQVAAFNLMYKVGSGDEAPHRTGLAHLFEHLMFSASQHVPSYDQALQRVGGQDNAYTTFDVTNYYCVLPSSNLETAFWLESDRMYYLSCTPHHLEVQRKVVIEEFKQTCFNKPYGDAWHHLLALAYEGHPYSWPTIGKEISHIEDVTLEEVKAFGKRFYHPSNAVLVVAGGVNLPEVKRLSEKWFSLESSPAKIDRVAPLAPAQRRKGQSKRVSGHVPFDVLYLAYHLPPRSHHDHLSLSLLAHLLGTGKSSLLYQKLVEELGWLTDLSIYTTDMLQGDLFMIEAELSEGTTFAQVEEVIKKTLADICTTQIAPLLWEKVKNQFESHHAFSHTSLLERADTLAYATWIDNPNFFNEEVGTRLAELSPEEMQAVGKRLLTHDKAITLQYAKQGKSS